MWDPDAIPLGLWTGLSIEYLPAFAGGPFDCLIVYAVGASDNKKIIAFWDAADRLGG